MAGDTLRGIGKKQIAEALEAASAAEHAIEPNGTAPAAAFDTQARPERSLDDLPSERTGHPSHGDAAHGDAAHGDAAHGHAAHGHAANGAHAGAVMEISTATTVVQDAAAVVPVAPESGPDAAIAATTTADDAVPLTSSATPRSGPNRVSFGTMIGHEMHAVQTRVAVTDGDASLRGTAHGRDVHLPAHPSMTVEPETAPAATSSPSLGIPAPHAEPPVSSTTSSDKFAPARDSLNEFSGGDHSFFDTAPVNDEYEPENPRGRLYTRLAVSAAVVAVVSVVVVAWVNSHASSEEHPIEVKSQPAVTAPVPVRTAVAAPAPVRPPAPPAHVQEAPPTSTIPSSMPERIAVTTPPPRPAKAPSLAPPAPAPPPRPAPVAVAAKPAPIAAPAPRPAPVAAPAPTPKTAPVAAAPAPVRELRTPPPAPPQKKPTAVAAAAPRPPAPPPPRAAAPPPPPPPAARPTPPVAKAPRPESAPARPVAKSTPTRPAKASPARGKQKYDPDGTLPLSFE